MFKISCLDYLKSTIKKRTREFLRDHLKFSRVRFLFIHIKDSQCSRTAMTGNRSSRAGHINVLYSRLPLSDLILNQLDNVLINTGMRNKYPVLPDVVFPFQQIIRVSPKTLCRLATILLCRQHLAVLHINARFQFQKIGSDSRH